MKPGWPWPLLVIAALSFTVGVNLVMLRAAGGDPNGAVVEPDYYRKAVEWDSTMARRAASQSLGWTASVSLGDEGEGLREVTVMLSDSLGSGVEDAHVEAVLIHNLEASQPVALTLEPREGGEYVGSAAAPRGGRWEVRVEAVRGGESFLATLHAEAP